LPGSFVCDVEVSQHTLVDSAMLGWRDGVRGSAAIVPTSFQPGDSAPQDRPPRNRAAATVDAAGNVVANEGVDALFGPVLTKEQKKAAAAAKKADRDAAKKDQGAATDSAKEVVRVKPAKTDLKRCKKLAADKRKAGDADALTDDELDFAGFLLEGEEA